MGMELGIWGCVWAWAWVYGYGYMGMGICVWGKGQGRGYSGRGHGGAWIGKARLLGGCAEQLGIAEIDRSELRAAGGDEA